MGQRNLGKVNFFINGRLLGTMPGATLAFGGSNATEEVNDQGEVNYVEEEVAAIIEVKIDINQNTNTKELRELRNGTASFEGDNGLVWALTGVGAKESGGWKVTKGGMDAVFFANEAKES